MKFTPDVQRKICAALASGMPRISALQMVGVGRRTFYDWMKASRTFRTAIKRAEAKVQRRLLGRIEKASRDPKHWTAAAWIMERRWPELFALRMTRMLEKEREAMLAELRKTMDEKTFGEVARALVAAQQNARGRGAEQRTH